ncbi:MAG: hypothetical protein WBG62_22645, partial [Cyclobacteriaceae bacterium]
MNKILIPLLIFILGCGLMENKTCKINYPKFTASNHPLIYIKNYIGSCQYIYEGDFFIDGYYKNYTDTMKIDGSKMNFKIGDEFVTLFDFRTKSNYQAQIDSVEWKIIIEGSIEDYIKVFRIKDSFLYDDILFDVVYFASKKEGVLG